jgi:hypothetical protein
MASLAGLTGVTEARRNKTTLYAGSRGEILSGLLHEIIVEIAAKRLHLGRAQSAKLLIIVNGCDPTCGGVVTRGTAGERHQGHHD